MAITQTQTPIQTQSIDNLITYIGIEPGAGPAYNDQLNARIAINPNISSSLRIFLIKQGLPEKEVRKALTSSLIKAYLIPAYREAWRRKCNPNWGLLKATLPEDNLDAGDNLDTPDDDNEPDPQTIPPAQSPSPDTNTPFNKDQLKTIFEQIAQTVTKLVDEKLAKANFKLDESAKEQIRTLAKTAAQDKILELMPPRQIEIVDAKSHTIIAMGLQHEKFPTLLRAIQARDHRNFRLNIWLTGPTGSGKTSAAEASAKALNLNFGSDGSLDADYKVLGFRDANGNIISTQFLDIYENGGIYVADEIDNWLPSALLSLNSALANGFTASPKGLIKRHEDCCVIACANTWGLGATNDYVGRTRLDAASLDRFHPKIEWPIDETLEKAIAEKQGGTLGITWQHTVHNARVSAQRQGLKIIISPRATFSGIALLKQGFSQEEVIDMTLGAGLSLEQKKAIGLRQASSNIPQAAYYRA